MEEFRFKKKFGQNFIRDINIINKMVNSAELDNDIVVIEVGPGAGILTKALVGKAGQVVAYEIDRSLEPILSKELEKTKVKIIYDDFLKRDLAKDLAEYRDNKLYFIANLPYYITTPIINKLIESNLKFDKIVIMVQKEVGDRFSAKVNSKAYNSLTVYLNYYFEIRKLFEVSRKCFYPSPKVDSVVLELRRKVELPKIKDEKLFFKLVRDAFRYKRKTIKNNLKDYDLLMIEEVLRENGLSLQSRAENITLEVFVLLANKIS